MKTSMNVVLWLLVLVTCPLGSSMGFVVVPPLIEQRNQKEVNRNSSINCTATGSDEKTYYWELPDNSQITTGRSGLYKPENCGPHRCRVENAAGKDVSNEIIVVGCGLEQISRVIRSEVVESGGHLALPCPTHKWLAPFKKNWEFSAKSPLNNKLPDRSFFAQNGSLYVWNLSKADSGSYTCSITDRINSKKVHVFQYDVTVKPGAGDRRNELVHFSDGIVTTEGSNVTIVCIFSQSDFSRPPSVTWSAPWFSKTSYESIHLENVKVGQSGTVNCSMAGASASIKLEVKVEPVCSEKFRSVNVSRGSSVTMECLEPPIWKYRLLRIQWLVNGVHRPADDDARSITLVGVTESFGVTVDVSNGVESRFYGAYVMVDDSTTTSSTTKTTTTTTAATTTTTSATINNSSKDLSTTQSLDRLFLPPPLGNNTKEPSTSHVDSSLRIETTPDQSPTTTSKISTELPIILVIVVVAVVVVLVVVALVVLVFLKRSSNKRKQEQNTAASQNALPLVFANNNNNNNNNDDNNNPAAMHDPGQGQNREPIARGQRIARDPEDDSISMRSSDSGFSDPTNEPLLKSNEQLNGENKSKSDSERTLADHHQLPDPPRPHLAVC